MMVTDECAYVYVCAYTRACACMSAGGGVQGVRNGFPLKIEAEEVETREAEFNPDFLRSMMRKLDWKALVASAHTVRDASADYCTDYACPDLLYERLCHSTELEQFWSPLSLLHVYT